MQNHKTAAAENLAYDLDLSLPAAGAAFEEYARLRDAGASPTEAEEAFMNQVMESLQGGESWASEFIRSAADKHLAKCEDVIATAESVGGEPAVALSAMDGMTGEVAVWYLGLRNEVARKMGEGGTTA